MSPRAAAEPLASAQRDGATSRKLALERVLHELGDALDQRTTEQPAQAGQIPRAMFRLGIDPHRHPVPPPQAHLGVVGRPGDVLHERATAAADLVDRRRQPLARHRASPSVLQREGDHGYGRAPGSGARDPDPVGVATALCEGLCGSLPEGVKSCHGVAASGEG